MSTRPHRRVSFEFDCIDADYVDASGPQLVSGFRAGQTKQFALLRVVTTPARFDDFAGATPEPGDWFHLEIKPDGRGLPAWHAQLEGNGYSTHARGVLTFARLLNTPDEAPPHPLRPQALGAAVVPQRVLPSPLATACAALPPPATPAEVSTILRNLPQATSILVRDVGQANFISLCDDGGSAILHFDVGFPISFNRHTFPSRFVVDRTEKPPIVLSHWDWDHLHGALLLPHLLDCHWIVPDQRLGPGAARLAHMLVQKGNLIVRPANARIRFPFGELVRSSGRPSDLNDSGLTILATLTSGRSALLTGDADYAHLMHANAAKVDHLIATHHGARFDAGSASVPKPNSWDGQLVISCGYRNVYGHPHPDGLSKHARSGWTTYVTTSGRRGVAGRGDRIVN